MFSFILAILFIFFAKPTFAQETTPAAQLFNQYQKDYQFQVNAYQTSYSNYLYKKQINTQYATAATQNDELISLKQTIINRNQMLKSYLMAIRVHLDEFPNINQDDTKNAQNNLSQLEQWLENQKIDTLNSTSELTTSLTEFKAKYYDIQKYIYTALVQYRLNLNLQTLNEINDLSTLLQSQPQNSNQNKIYYDEILTKAQFVLTFQQNALDLTKKESVVPTRFLNFYPDATIELDNAKNYLSQMFADLKTIVTKMTD